MFKEILRNYTRWQFGNSLDLISERVIDKANAAIMAKYKHQHIIWIAQYCYRKCNPESKMDVPSIVYEQIEKDYGKFIEDQTRKTS
jgi:hypothetical protein